MSIFKSIRGENSRKEKRMQGSRKEEEDEGRRGRKREGEKLEALLIPVFAHFSTVKGNKRGN